MASLNLPANWKKAVEELVRGRESANELKDLLRQTSATGDLVLVEKILSSFANSIAMLRSSKGGNHSDEVSQNLMIKSEDSGDSIRSSGRKDGRGCYKRRRCLDSWIKEITGITDDGHSWRKYGQKDILKAKHPRSYYRCTHKYDQGCQATKQVQQIEDDPAKYRIIYYGHHTCTKFLNASQLLLDSASRDTESSFLLSFETGGAAATPAGVKTESPFFSPSSAVKQEYKDNKASEVITHQYHQSSSTTTKSDYLVSPEITSGGMMMLSSSESEHLDIFSGVVDSFYLDDVFASL